MADEPERAPDALRLLFVVPFSPRRDAHHGGGRAAAHLLRRIAERHRVALVYLRWSGSEPVDSDIAARCELVEELELDADRAFGSPWRRRLRVLAAPLTGMPSAVAALHQRRLSRAALGVAGRFAPDLIQVEHDTLAYLGTELAAAGARAPRVLVAHDPGGPAAEDQARVESGRRRFAHRADAAAWRRYSSRTLSAFDALVALSERDAHELRAALPAARVEVIGLGVEVPEEPLHPTGDGRASVLFIGGYRHPPNADAALRLLESIMPSVRRRIPGVGLALVGADPGPELVAAGGEYDEVTGAVPDVTPYLDRAALVALPIRLGGGMRVKLLEAMAAGKAVVASPQAAAGLEVEAGAQLELAETDAQFADAIVALAGDDQARARLGTAAREWARTHLSWDARVREYEALYRSLTGDAARSGER